MATRSPVETPPAPTSLLILAGGRATRLSGARKALLDVGGRPILAHVLEALGPLAEECLALVRDTDMPPLDGLKLLVDPAPHAGVLPAVLHGLRRASGEACMIVAGDMPFVKKEAFELCVTFKIMWFSGTLDDPGPPRATTTR